MTWICVDGLCKQSYFKVESGIDFIFVTFRFSNGIIMCDKCSNTNMYTVTVYVTVLFLYPHVSLRVL